MSKENSIRIVALSTVLSRFTGFVRDVLVYAVFGTSAINSAFIIAFTIPNLFRRFMGEGALTSALVPVLAHEEREKGKEAVFALFNRVISRAAILLIIIVIVGVAAFQLVHFIKIPDESLRERLSLAAKLGVWIFPYLFFICLSALIGVVLNLQKRFASTALAQIWVNLSMTLMLGGIGIYVSNDDYIRMLWLCAGVLLGGVLQLLLPGYALTREGWKPKFDLSPDKERLKEVWMLFGPGLLGATVAQIDVAISQLLAFGLNDAATSVLFLSNRLMQLPLGVFAIAVTTVTFPIIAQRAAAKDEEGLATAYRDSATLIQAVMIPAGVGLALLAEPVLVAFFKWGSFDAASVLATTPILIIYALGIPFYAGTTLTIRALHSLKDMQTPVRWGVITLLTNLALSLTLPHIPFASLPGGKIGTMGLAFANVLSTALFSFGLRYELKRKVAAVARVKAPVIKIVAAAMLMMVLVVPLLVLLPENKLGRFICILVGGSGGAIIYAAGLYFFSRETFLMLKKLVFK